MTDNFERAFIELLGHEGGYVNDPNDPGGETNWGITVKVARDFGYAGPMRDMPQSVAKKIYGLMYWLPAFEKMPYPIAFQVFDAAVNSGVGQAVRFLQRAVDLATDGDLGDVADDGKLGPRTLDAVAAADQTVLVALFNAERLLFMTKLSNWQHHGKGWARRIVKNIQKGVL